MKTMSWGRFRQEVDTITELTQIVRRDENGAQEILGFWMPELKIAGKRRAFEADIMAQVAQTAGDPSLGDENDDAEIAEPTDYSGEFPMAVTSDGFDVIVSSPDYPYLPGPILADGARGMIRGAYAPQYRPVPKPIAKSKPKRRG